ncbi:MAG: STAS domain-containing protein [Mariprofundales bacterium]|nr:STAS domain-containing protein [Mariprofundales bacterium]
MDMELNIEKKVEGGDTVRLILCGRVDLVSSPKLLATLDELFLSAVRTVTVDLSDVGEIDSAGIATLVEGLAWSRRSGGSFVLTGICSRVRDAFGLAKLEQEFTVV